MKNKKLITLVVVGVTIFLGFSCSPVKRRQRKAEKHINKARILSPQLFTVDTLVIRDTIIIEKIEYFTHDSIVYNERVTVINNENVKLEYLLDSIGQIRHFLEQKQRDTIIERVEIRENLKVVYRDKKEGYSKESKYLLIILAMILLTLIFYFMRKK